VANPVVTARRAGPSLESLFIAALALFGFRLGARTISDNSEFVHLRTGIRMVAGHGIPRSDPYSFTAHGTKWIVQSWLPEWTYGVLHKLGGFPWVELEQAVLMGLSAWLIVRLARAGTPLRTLLAGAAAIGVGSAYWTPRPLMFGVLAFVLTVTVVEKRANPWWLVPIIWVWVNSHGSFPLGLLWIGAVAVGAALDGRRWPRVEARYVGTVLVGLAVSAINPLGPRLLTFALTVGEKRKIFQSVVEWHSPNFQSNAGLFTLAFLVVALVVLLRGRAALGWRDIVPGLGFLAIGLLALRNLPMLGVALAPALGRVMRPATPSEPSSAGMLNRVFAALLAAVFLLFGITALSRGGVDVHDFPVAAVNYMDRHGLRSSAHHVAEQDVVGCYLILRYGDKARVFIDDRVDMYPVAVAQDYIDLLYGHANALEVLDHRKVDVILWDKNLALVAIARASGRWHQVYGKGGWVVLVRNGVQT
jgi:hypothetical protein